MVLPMHSDLFYSKLFDRESPCHDDSLPEGWYGGHPWLPVPPSNSRCHDPEMDSEPADEWVCRGPGLWEEVRTLTRPASLWLLQWGEQVRVGSEAGGPSLAKSDKTRWSLFTQILEAYFSTKAGITDWHCICSLNLPSGVIKYLGLIITRLSGYPWGRINTIFFFWIPKLLWGMIKMNASDSNLNKVSKKLSVFDAPMRRGAVKGG